MDRLTSRILRQKDSSCKCHLCKKVGASPRLVPQVLEYRAEYKDKLPDVSDSHRNIGTPCDSKLK